MSAHHHSIKNAPFLPSEEVKATPEGGYATRADWNRLRPVITRLYVDEEKTLKEVIAVMERDHGHRATAKMYKDRIRKWHLDKKTKEPEAWALLKLKLKRDAAGKDSKFSVRGKAVTIDDVLRYFKRKGIVDPEGEVEVQSRAAEESVPLDIKCWTPVPSPKQGFATTQDPGENQLQPVANWSDFLDSEMSVVPFTPLASTQSQDYTHGYLKNDQARQILFSNPNVQSFDVPYSPLPPESLLVPEKLFASIRAYYIGAFNDGLFEADQYGNLRRATRATRTLRESISHDFQDLCITGANLMGSHSFAEGRRCFSKASKLVYHILCSQEERTLEIILNTFITLNWKGCTEIITILQNLMSAMAIELFPEEHPWTQLFSQMGKLDDSEFEHVFAEAWRCMCNLFANTLGEFHFTTILCYTDFLIETDASNAANKLYNLFLRAEQQLERLCQPLLYIKYSYGRGLSFDGKYAEAIAMLEEAVVGYSEVEGCEYQLAITLEWVSYCYGKMGEIQMAEMRLEEAIAVLTTRCGKGDPQILKMKAVLESWLRECGREAEANVLQAERDEILGPDDIYMDLED